MNSRVSGQCSHTIRIHKNTFYLSQGLSKYWVLSYVFKWPWSKVFRSSILWLSLYKTEELSLCRVPDKFSSLFNQEYSYVILPPKRPRMTHLNSKLYFEIFRSGSIQETHLVMYVNYIRTTCEWYKNFSTLYRHLDDILDYCIELFVNIFCHADYEIVWTFLTPKFCSIHISN